MTRRGRSRVPADARRFDADIARVILTRCARARRRLWRCGRLRKRRVAQSERAEGAKKAAALDLCVRASPTTARRISKNSAHFAGPRLHCPTLVVAAGIAAPIVLDSTQTCGNGGVRDESFAYLELRDAGTRTATANHKKPMLRCALARAACGSAWECVSVVGRERADVDESL